MTRDVKLDCLFKPAAVAIVGASNNEGKVGYTLLKNLIRSGYSGTIVPINPKEESVQGLKAYKTVKAFPGRIDVAVIVIPRPFVVTSVQDCIEAGCRAISIITAGFKEQNEEGAALERQIKALCDKAGVRCLGPNCLGHLNTHHSMDLTFGNNWPHKGAVSFISQSGALCCAILDRAAKMNLGLSKLVSMGNKADLSETDFLAALAEDETTDVIVTYVESVNEGAAFMKTAEAVSRRKPIVIFKSGVTSAGASAASSHTGSLAGSDAAYQAAFGRTGVIRAGTFEQMFEFAIGFGMQPLPAGGRVVVVTNAGGPGIMTTDAIELSGMTMAKLSPETAAALKEFLPPAASVKNPVDVLGDAGADRYRRAIALVRKDPNVDAIIVVLTPQSVTDCVGTAQAIIDEADRAKPVLSCFMGGENIAPACELLARRNIPNYSSPERAVHALKAMVDYAAWRRKPAAVAKALPVERKAAAAILEEHLASGSLQIAEPEAKAIFRAYGIQVAPGGLARTDEEAGALAEKIGYPVVMKIVSPDVIHKSDMGGVKLNLGSRADVVEASRAMKAHILKQLPAANIRGVYVERMLNMKGAREIIIGVSRDAQFGAMIMFGLGGIFVEVLKDVTFDIAPVSAEQAREMMKRIRTYPLLEGVRGQAGVALDTLADTIQRVSQLVTDFPRIKELDINPFIARDQAAESMAADARITLSKA